MKKIKLDIPMNVYDKLTSYLSMMENQVDKRGLPVKSDKYVCLYEPEIQEIVMAIKELLEIRESSEKIKEGLEKAAENDRHS